MSLEDWKTREEAAEILGCHPNYLNEYVNAGILERMQRKDPGAKSPKNVYHPGDLERIRGGDKTPRLSSDQVDSPALVKVEAPPNAQQQLVGQLTKVLGSGRLEQVLDLLVTKLAPPEASRSEAFKTLAEAVTYTRIPERRLVGFVRSGRLENLGDGGKSAVRAKLLFRTRDLDAL